MTVKTYLYTGLQIVLGAVLMCLSLVAGVLASAHMALRWPFYLLGLVSAAVPPLLSIANHVLLRKARDRIDETTVRDIDRFLTLHREKDYAPLLFRHLECTHRLTVGLVGLLSLSGLVLAFCGGLLFPTGVGSSLTSIYAAIVVACACLRLPKPLPPVEEGDMVCPEDYPRLYALARQAQTANHGHRRILLTFSFDDNVGIMVHGDTAYLTLGVTLLAVLTEEELYAVLLHEFAHASAITPEYTREKHYAIRREMELENPITVWSTLLFFRYWDAKYMLLRELHSFSATLSEEYAADRAMLLSETPQAAGSALLKIAFSQFDQWEIQDGSDSFYRPETMPTDSVHREIRRFCQSLDCNAQRWTDMAQRQIQGRSDTHPTLRNRLDAMGLGPAQLVPGTRSAAYEQEVSQAVDRLEAMVIRDMGPGYAQQRQVYYAEPLARVERWAQAGRPLIAEQYPDLLGDLYSLCRFGEMEELCDRAMESLPLMSSHDAWFWKGYLLLHRFDPAGLDALYEAIGANKNHLEDGLEAIGDFCLMTGRQQELEEYRARALELAQEDHDEYSHVNCLEKGDRLSAEHLPPELEQAVLQFLNQVDGGAIQQVYLVHKQITEDFFTSAMVVQFRKETSDAQAADILHQIFRYLDTSTDWQFSLFSEEEVKKVHVESVPGSRFYPRT